MYRERTILALIPARGGSKGIPKKNIKPLLHKPLISYTIESAKQSRYIDRVIVTTDDAEIARISREWGAEVPFMRPKELAADDTPGIAPVLHALTWLEKEEGFAPGYVVLLQPTSPLRNTDDIDRAIETLFAQEGTTLISVSESKDHPFWMQTIEEGCLKPFMDADVKNKYYRRQDLPKVYRFNGAIYMAGTEYLLANQSFFSERTVPYLMPRERSIDIDDAVDFQLAELILRGERYEQ